MQCKFLKTSLVGLMLTVSGLANADIMTFDDIPGGSFQNQYGNVTEYAGYDFSSTVQWIDVVNSSWKFGAHSGSFAMLNNNGGNGVIQASNGSDFYFGGLWGKRWSTAVESGGNESLFGLISGTKDGQTIWQISTGLNGSYKFFGAQAGAIDTLDIDMGEHFLVDDLVLLSEQPGTDVPEPSSLAIFALGIMGLASRKMKKR